MLLLIAGGDYLEGSPRSSSPPNGNDDADQQFGCPDESANQGQRRSDSGATKDQLQS
jgi:hypothetical protein